MASPHIFFIGASGHIGAAVLKAVKDAHPGLTIDALVRSKNDCDHITETYQSSVNVVQGSLEDLSLVETLAAKAQIIINCAPDIIHSTALAALLSSLSTSPFPHKFYLHTSGAARIWAPPNGNVPGRTWDDILDLGAFPPDVTHGPTDIQVQSASTSSLHPAIISPSYVIGRSPSRAHAAPTTFPDWMHVVRELGGVFVVDKGENITAFADTESLAGLYLALVDDALGIIEEGKPVSEEVWGPRGHYFAADLEVSMREFATEWLLPALRRAGKKGEVLAGDGEVREVGVERVVELVLGRVGGGLEANIWSRHIAEGFGTSMRVRGSRAKKFLGYQGVGGLPGLDHAVKLGVDM